MKQILIIIMMVVVCPLFSNAQDVPENVIDENSVIDFGEDDPVTGFEGGPEMPSQQEIEKLRKESGYNDFKDGSDVKNKEPECFDYYQFQSVQV